MITRIGKFECCILRDAMRVAAQLNSKARMRIDATGIHIGATHLSNASTIWVDIPAETFEAQWDPEDPAFTDEIAIDCEKLCRMLYAYEGRHEIEFSFEYKMGEGIRKTPDMDTIRTSHKLHASCEVDAPILRDWLRKLKIKYDTDSVIFMYDKKIGKFPAKILSKTSPYLDPIVMDHPVANKGAPKSFSTLLSLELLQEAIAPECIDGTIQILFGMDTLIYMSTEVNGCSVTLAIAPRIEL